MQNTPLPRPVSGYSNLCEQETAELSPTPSPETHKRTTAGPMSLALPGRHQETGMIRSVQPVVPAIVPLPPASPSVQSTTTTSTAGNQAQATPTTQGQSQQKASPEYPNIFQQIQQNLRRVPEMRQMAAVECGAACLAMILSYYGRSTTIAEVQERCGVGRDGLSALAIVKAARQYGLNVQAGSMKQNNFSGVPLPAIIHWEFNHFVIVERWSPKHVDIVDPALGRRRLTFDKFEAGFTGVAIMLEPGPQFEKQAPKRTFTLWSYTRSLLGMRGVVAQIIGISLVLQLLGLVAPLFTAIVIDDVISNRNLNFLLVLAIGAVLLYLSRAAMSLLRAFLLIYLQTHVNVQMMLKFFEHMLSLPYRFFQLRLNGDLLTRVNSNEAIRDLLTNQLISTILDSSTVVIYFVILLTQSPMITVATLIIGALQVGLIVATAPAIRNMMMQDLAAQGKATGYMNEALSAIATLKAAGAEHRALARWSNLFMDQMNISIRRNYLVSIIGIIFDLLQTLSPLLLVWLGAIQVIQGTMTVGNMLALNTLASLFLAPLSSLATSGQKIQIARAHFERIADVMEAKSEQDPQQVQMPPRLAGQIEVRNVSFEYAPNTPAVLKDINVQIRPGRKVAIVGKTGSGKSTLGKLLIGLITPTKGTLLFDGRPLHTMNYQAVRSQFGVVLQESAILSGSVRENIALNNPEMDLAQVVRAAQMAAIHEDIEKMPMKYETLVSEGGSALSGGQRQRLALARALASNPAILLLDEATSALDVATERLVEENLNRLACTRIVIAHRLSTIRNADVILVLDQGRIVESGSHEMLLRRNGYYARLIQLQIENGEIEAA